MQYIAGAYLQVHIAGYTHTLHLNTSSSQGRHPLMISQCALGTGGTPMFGTPSPLHFIDQLKNGKLWKEDMHNRATTRL